MTDTHEYALCQGLTRDNEYCYQRTRQLLDDVKAEQGRKAYCNKHRRLPGEARACFNQDLGICKGKDTRTVKWYNPTCYGCGQRVLPTPVEHDSLVRVCHKCVRSFHPECTGYTAETLPSQGVPCFCEECRELGESQLRSGDLHLWSELDEVDRFHFEYNGPPLRTPKQTTNGRRKQPAASQTRATPNARGTDVDASDHDESVGGLRGKGRDLKLTALDLDYKLLPNY